MKRTTTVLTTFSVLLAALSGCAPTEGAGKVDRSLSLSEAKSIAQKMEVKLASYVPKEAVASVEQRSTGALISCDRDRGYQWSGRTDVVYKDGASIDPQDLVDVILAAYDNQKGFQAESAPTVDQQPGVHVAGSYGAGYLVNESVDRASVQILSFSPCFVLPQGMSPSTQY